MLKSFAVGVGAGAGFFLVTLAALWALASYMAAVGFAVFAAMICSAG